MTFICLIVLVAPLSHYHRCVLWKETTASCKSLSFITRLDVNLFSFHQKKSKNHFESVLHSMAANRNSVCCSPLQPSHSDGCFYSNKVNGPYAVMFCLKMWLTVPHKNLRCPPRCGFVTLSMLCDTKEKRAFS